MKQDSFFHPAKLILGFVIIVLVALLFGGCGSTVGVGYQHPHYGSASVTVALPRNGGLAK